MKTAIVTGASSGIGLEIVKTLVGMEYRVYGLARDFGKSGFSDPDFIPVTCDVTDTAQLQSAVQAIKEKEKQGIFLLVNNAGVGFFGPHEQLKPRQIEIMTATNLQAPLILTSLLLRDIKQSQGFIINIASVTAKKSSTHGCAYAATKAGLAHFSLSLFDEIRKTGAKVVCIYPDMTQTAFYDQADFREGDDPESYITPRDVAEAVKMVLAQPAGTVVTELTIRPQKHQIVRKTSLAAKKR